MNTDLSFEAQKKRLHSLDALRGFDMFWIVGGGALIRSLAKSYPLGWLSTFATQFEHARWEGFHFYDLIFPLFMFISGVAIPFAIISKMEKGIPRKQLILKIFRRMVVLVILGIIYNGALKNGFSGARYASILGQIGIAYFFAALIVIFSGSLKKRLYWLIGILVGYAFIQLFIPVPGVGAGVLTPEGSINGYIDRMLLPGQLAYGINGMLSDKMISSGNGIYDALGLLSIVSATAITLMGSFAGYLLRLNKISELRKIGLLAGIGICLVILGLIISPFYPIIKNCWTSTYNLLAGGISFILIALFYLIIDVWGWKKWPFFFRVVGMNSIFVYLFVSIVNIRQISAFLFGWVANSFEEKNAQLIIISGSIVLTWLLLYFMYKKRIFIKV